MQIKEPLEFVVANPIPNDNNHATLLEYQIGVPSIEHRVDLSIIAQMLNRRLYDKLRTEQQLGYIVGANTGMDSSVERLQCIVEGSIEKPGHVMKLMQKEISALEQHIKMMPDAEFEHWKNAARVQISQPEVNFGQEFEKTWSQILNHGHCFNKKNLELAYLESNLSAKRIHH